MKLSIAALGLFCCFVTGMLAAQSQRPEERSRDVVSAEYFPPGAFDPDKYSFKQKWYALTLSALNEPSLYPQRDGKSIEVYRLLWIPSFSRPVSVRLKVNADGTGSIVTRSVDSHSGLLTKPVSDTGKLILDTTAAIDQAQVKDVLEQLQHFDFWSMPTEKQPFAPPSGSASGGRKAMVLELDGSRWILEGVRGGEYHVVDRWSPKDDSYSQLCKYLLQLGKVETTKLY